MRVEAIVREHRAPEKELFLGIYGGVVGALGAQRRLGSEARKNWGLGVLASNPNPTLKGSGARVAGHG